MYTQRSQQTTLLPLHSWDYLPPLPSPRVGLACVSRGPYLYALGGVDGDGQPSRSVFIFDTRGGAWREGPACQRRKGMTKAVVVDGVVLAVGEQRAAVEVGGGREGRGRERWAGRDTDRRQSDWNGVCA
jgi:hypothetical protein